VRSQLCWMRPSFRRIGGWSADPRGIAPQARATNRGGASRRGNCRIIPQLGASASTARSRNLAAALQREPSPRASAAWGSSRAPAFAGAQPLIRRLPQQHRRKPSGPSPRRRLCAVNPRGALLQAVWSMATTTDFIDEHRVRSAKNAGGSTCAFTCGWDAARWE
jgi:hypothetical protein